jgi:hypothetical protein
MTAQAVGPSSLSAAQQAVVSNLGTPLVSHSVTVQGTFTGLTLVLEGSFDGSTWFGLKLTQATTAGTVASDVVSAAGVYATTVLCPLPNIRARATAIASGAALVSLASC